MTINEMRELLSSMTLGHFQTTTASKFTIYELCKALAASDTSLHAQAAKSSDLQQSLSAANTALATLVEQPCVEAS